MLTKDENLLFLESKIQDIKLAMFRAEIPSELQLPNNIITSIKTDSFGNIWFFTSCYGAYASHIDKQFFAHLSFFQKQQGYQLRLSGPAVIVDGDQENYEPPALPLNGGIVLIKFKIMFAEYIEKKTSIHATAKDKIKSFFTDKFVRHSNKLFDFT